MIASKYFPVKVEAFREEKARWLVLLLTKKKNAGGVVVKNSATIVFETECDDGAEERCHEFIRKHPLRVGLEYGL